MAIESARHVLSNPRASARRPVAKLKHLLVDPDSFFGELSGKSGLRQELVLLAIGGIFGFLSLLYVIKIVEGTYTGGTGVNAGVGDGDALGLRPDTHRRLYGLAVGPFLGIFFAWVAISSAAMGITWLHNGRGSLLETMKLTAWGFVPIVIGHAIYYGVLAGVFTLVVELESDVLLGNTVSTQATWILNHGREHPLALVAAVVSLAMILWSAHLWAYAVKHARNVSLRHARIAVGVPTAIYLLYLVNRFLQDVLLFPSLS